MFLLGSQSLFVMLFNVNPSNFYHIYSQIASFLIWWSICRKECFRLFSFTSKFLQHTKSERKKLYSMNLINFVLMLLLLTVSALPLSFVFNLWATAFFTGQGNSGSLILVTVGALLLIVLMFLMLTFPLLTGSIRSIYHAVAEHDSVKWSHLFQSFKGKVWLKSVLVGLTSTLFMLVVFIVDYFITVGLRNMFGSLATSETSVMLVLFVISIISSIYTWLMFVFIINMVIAFIKNPQDKVRDDMKAAWQAMRNGQKTFLSFYIGILLLNFVLLLITGPVIATIQMNLAHISQNTAQIITWVVNVLYFFIRYTVYFFIIGTIVTYYHHQGRKDA